MRNVHLAGKDSLFVFGLFVFLTTFTCTSFTKTIGGVCICIFFLSFFLFRIFNTIIVNIGYIFVEL